MIAELHSERNYVARSVPLDTPCDSFYKSGQCRVYIADDDEYNDDNFDVDPKLEEYASRLALYGGEYDGEMTILANRNGRSTLLSRTIVFDRNPLPIITENVTTHHSNASSLSSKILGMSINTFSFMNRTDPNLIMKQSILLLVFTVTMYVLYRLYDLRKGVSKTKVCMDQKEKLKSIDCLTFDIHENTKQIQQQNQINEPDLINETESTDLSWSKPEPTTHIFQTFRNGNTKLSSSITNSTYHMTKNSFFESHEIDIQRQHQKFEKINTTIAMAPLPPSGEQIMNSVLTNYNDLRESAKKSGLLVPEAELLAMAKNLEKRQYQYIQREIDFHRTVSYDLYQRSIDRKLMVKHHKETLDYSKYEKNWMQQLMNQRQKSIDNLWNCTGSCFMFCSLFLCLDFFLTSFDSWMAISWWQQQPQHQQQQQHASFIQGNNSASASFFSWFCDYTFGTKPMLYLSSLQYGTVGGLNWSVVYNQLLGCWNILLIVLILFGTNRFMQVLGVPTLIERIVKTTIFLIVVVQYNLAPMVPLACVTAFLGLCHWALYYILDDKYYCVKDNFARHDDWEELVSGSRRNKNNFDNSHTEGILENAGRSMIPTSAAVNKCLDWYDRMSRRIYVGYCIGCIVWIIVLLLSGQQGQGILQRVRMIVL